MNWRGKNLGFKTKRKHHPHQLDIIRLNRTLINLVTSCNYYYGVITEHVYIHFENSTGFYGIHPINILFTRKSLTSHVVLVRSEPVICLFGLLEDSGRNSLPSREDTQIHFFLFLHLRSKY